MAAGRIVIEDALCLGCGYCVHFCPQGCLVITGEKYSPQGYLLPSFINQEKCTACCVCSWMCPHFAIDVYKSLETATS